MSVSMLIMEKLPSGIYLQMILSKTWISQTTMFQKHGGQARFLEDHHMADRTLQILLGMVSRTPLESLDAWQKLKE